MVNLLILWGEAGKLGLYLELTNGDIFKNFRFF